LEEDLSLGLCGISAIQGQDSQKARLPEEAEEEVEADEDQG
jgi:hypothetical protein